MLVPDGSLRVYVARKTGAGPLGAPLYEKTPETKYRRLKPA